MHGFTKMLKLLEISFPRPSTGACSWTPLRDFRPPDLLTLCLPCINPKDASVYQVRYLITVIYCFKMRYQL